MDKRGPSSKARRAQVLTECGERLAMGALSPADAALVHRAMLEPEPDQLVEIADIEAARARRQGKVN